MNMEQFTLKDHFERDMHCFKWSPATRPIAIVQIIHGMAEHAARYDDFARFLTNHGFVVFCSDLRGHGTTVGVVDKTGFFSYYNGWKIVSENVYQLTSIASKQYPELPLFLFGHSMGSLLARTYMTKHKSILKGVILSGTSYTPRLMLGFGKLIAVIQKKIKGYKYRSQLLDKLSFGSFNNKFKPARTKFDWLSRDEKQVDKYMNDDFCGFVCTASLFLDLFNGISLIQSKSHLKSLAANLPIYLFSGEMDPVGDFTKGVKKVASLYKKHGAKDVEMKFYKGGRHEMLNEINKQEVYQDVLDWIMKKIDVGS